MTRRTRLVAGAILATCLACAGGTAPAPEPEPAPDPAPAAPEPAPPKPAPRAERCRSLAGVPLPLEGGTIIECAPRRVAIDHGEEDPTAKRWDYAHHFKERGWSQAEPKGSDPVVIRGPERVVFEASAGRVILVYEPGRR